MTKTKIKQRTWLLPLIAIIVLFGAADFLDFLRIGGAFRDINPHQPGECHKIEGIIGGEDLQWRPNNREIFVSAQDRRNLDAPGHIYLITPRKDGESQVLDITPELDVAFHPHGLYLLDDDDVGERLFVINHRGGESPQSTIEIFDVNDDRTLTHLSSIEDEALNSPNDLVATGPEQFYVTNDHGSSSKLGQTLETLFRLPLGNLLYFDGAEFRVVHKRTKYANGVNISANGQEIYLAEVLRHSVKVFKIQSDRGDLELQESIHLNSGIDNIDVHPDGSLWIAGHPKLLSYISHASDPETRSPSQVLRVHRDDSGQWQYEEIYLDEGDPISGSSTGIMRDGLLVIGPVFDPHLLVCEITQ